MTHTGDSIAPVILDHVRHRHRRQGYPYRQCYRQCYRYRHGHFNGIFLGDVYEEFMDSSLAVTSAVR